MKRKFVLSALALALGLANASEAAGPSCTLKFRVGTSTKLYAASVFAVYTNAPGDFPGTSTGVSCSLLNGTLGAFGDVDAGPARSLQLTLVGTPSPISGPKEVVQCTWIPTTRFPVTGDFDLSVQSGTNQSFQQVDPQITLSSIVCTGSITTTTTTTTTSSSTTTTTLPAQACGDANNDTKLSTADALNILKAAVGQKACANCVCDIDNSGSITTVDALKVLKKSVGASITLTCPACSA